MEKKFENKCVRIIFTGITGAGKSTVANVLFGYPVFDVSCSFSSVTKCSQRYSQIVRGIQLTAIDTPGFYDTSNNVDIDSEIENCINLSIPGPHVIVNVVKIGRLTEQDFKSVTFFIEKFGNEVQNYSLLVLTRFDDYKKEFGTDDFNFENIVSSLPKKFQLLFRNTFENRYILFDKNLSGSQAIEQESRFMQKFNDIIDANGGNYYTNVDFQKAVIADKKRKEDERENQERQKEEERERIRQEEREKIRQENSIPYADMFRGMSTFAESCGSACSLAEKLLDYTSTTDKTITRNPKPPKINAKSTPRSFVVAKEIP